MKDKILKLFFVITCIASLFIVINVKADSGPKPFLEITFVNMPYEEYSVALLAKEKSTGPYHRVDKDDSEFNEYYNGLNNIEKKFYDYEDVDGYMYIGGYKTLKDGNNVYRWNYYPPHDFKILVYIEETDTLIISNEAYSRYAFSSYFTASYADGTIHSVQPSYNYTKEILNLISRVLITIIVEVGLAFLFKYHRKSILIIIGTNVATQILLNVLINLDVYKYGWISAIGLLMLVELIIVIIEILIYVFVLPIFEREQGVDDYGLKGKGIIYGFVANLASLFIGFLILIPLMR